MRSCIRTFKLILIVDIGVSGLLRRDLPSSFYSLFLFPFLITAYSQQIISSHLTLLNHVPITSHHTTSHHTTSHHITPHHITSHHNTSHHTTSHHITSYHITSHHTTSHHTTTHHSTSHHITSHHIKSHLKTTSLHLA